jgi:hypothetical protein
MYHITYAFKKSENCWGFGNEILYIGRNITENTIVGIRNYITSRHPDITDVVIINWQKLEAV